MLYDNCCVESLSLVGFFAVIRMSEKSAFNTFMEDTPIMSIPDVKKMIVFSLIPRESRAARIT